MITNCFPALLMFNCMTSTLSVKSPNIARTYLRLISPSGRRAFTVNILSAHRVSTRHVQPIKPVFEPASTEDGTSTVIGLVCALFSVLEAPGDRSESSYFTRYDR